MRVTTLRFAVVVLVAACAVAVLRREVVCPRLVTTALFAVVGWRVVAWRDVI